MENADATSELRIVKVAVLMPATYHAKDLSKLLDGALEDVDCVLQGDLLDGYQRGRKSPRWAKVFPVFSPLLPTRVVAP